VFWKVWEHVLKTVVYLQPEIGERLACFCRRLVSVCKQRLPMM